LKTIPVLSVLVAAAAAAVLARPPRAGAGDEPPVRVAVFDLSRVFEESADLKKLLGEVRVLFEPREKALRKEREDLERRLGQADLPAAERQEALKRLQGVLAQQAEVARQADARKLEALRKFEAKLQGAVASVSRARGVDLLLGRTRVDAEGASGAAALATALSSRAVWFASDRPADLTGAVLEAVNAD
jgi:Skp family chaperone for outer membrane proteins